MKTKEFEKLKIGEICIVKRGLDEGKKGEVLWKQEDQY